MKLAIVLSLVLGFLIYIGMENVIKLFLLALIIIPVNIVFIVLASATNISIKNTIIVTNVSLTFLIVSNYKTIFI